MKSGYQRDISFIEVLFIVAKIENQPKCPLMNELIKNMWFIFTMEYNSVTKRMKSHLQQHGWRKRMLQ
jgi:hypothetical protein